MPLTYLDGQNNFHIHVDLLTSHPMPAAHLTLSTKLRSLQVYEELATWYDRQGQAKLRDWFLVLAADLALTRSAG